MTNTRLVLIQALSPIHCGTGHATGAIDLPIARENPSGLPFIPGSSLKGVLRARSEADDANASLSREVFGPDTDHAAEHAGAVQFSDASLLCLPVRSIRGTFAWMTSPYLLRRFARDAREAGLALPDLPEVPAKLEEAHVPGDGDPRSALLHEDRVYCEDLDFAAKRSKTLATFGKALAEQLFDDATERTHFIERLCLVPDDVMAVLSRTAMQVIARNRIDPDKGTVQRGALWTEEALPVETLLAALIVATPVSRGDGSTEAGALLDHVARLVEGRALQVGGKATIGRGMCRVKVVS